MRDQAHPIPEPTYDMDFAMYVCGVFRYEAPKMISPGERADPATVIKAKLAKTFETLMNRYPSEPKEKMRAFQRWCLRRQYRLAGMEQLDVEFNPCRPAQK